MKLLFCEVCYDVIKLTLRTRTCACGRVKGRYLDDGHSAQVNGKGYTLAIGNGSLVKAIAALETIQAFDEYNKDEYIDNCRIEYAWVRPHCGTGNPRTTINEDL